MKKIQICILGGLIMGGVFLGGNSVLSASDTSTVYNPVIVPSDFSTSITNPYFSLPVGTTFESRGETEDGTETIKIEIPGDTKMVMGVKTLVYRDKVWLDGELIEDTKDYLAQDSKGNVWYFGEDVNNYEDGKLKDHHGSWIAGADGALPGIWMKAKPVVGETYRQEYYKGEAEDTAKVLSLTETVKVPYGTFTNCLKTLDINPLEKGTDEYKYYCKQVKGFALEVGVASGERIELVDVQGVPSSNTDGDKMTKMQTLIDLLKQLIGLLVQSQNSVKNNIDSQQPQGHTLTALMKKQFGEKALAYAPSGWNVVRIQYDPMCTGDEAYDVTISNGHGENKSYIFDRNGTLIQSEIDKSFATAPSSLLTILKNSYASYTYGDTYEALTMANGEQRYLVDISRDSGKTNAELILGTDGKVICLSK